MTWQRRQALAFLPRSWASVDICSVRGPRVQSAVASGARSGLDRRVFPPSLVEAVITNGGHWESYCLVYRSVHSQRLDRSAESRRSVFLHVAVEVGIVSGHGDRLRTYNLLLLNVCSNCTGFSSFSSRRSPERMTTQRLLISIPTQILE